MVKKRTSIVKSRVIVSDDNKHRYLLERIWNDDKPKATVIMLNPSYADEIKGDNTSTKIINHLVDVEIELDEEVKIRVGGIKIVNIFSYIETESKELKKEDYTLLYDKITDIELKNAIKSSEIIIIAWGKEDKKIYRNRKNEIRNILKKYYSNKVYYFINDDNTPSSHPSIMKNNSKLAKYDFNINSI
ncbi:DUF1643 domain-containing protein [Clostridium kluyveri]|uniref:DUF1643 domain-containing protein n=1 Tax=Clostridium kluyveri TaxID=1534 RepID=UPI0022458383|nr:DUF1643 domain-containing protein [Clostridium kluyveri]UZQ49303.1 DUF1643 domain-containing protein [Clostridium kluyveri]